jgi:hypothetical protein
LLGLPRRRGDTIEKNEATAMLEFASRPILNRRRAGFRARVVAIVLAVGFLPFAPGQTWAEEAKAATAPSDRQQPMLVEQQLAHLSSRVGGATNIYMIGVAGWDAQDVFIKELDGAIDALAHVLPIENRVVRLVNHRSTLQTIPMASPDNFAAAVRGLAKIMNKDEDVLVLFMTSHGSPWGFELRAGDRFGELAPRSVASVLDRNGIKNRMVIVSACFSGTFVRPLANDHTIVLTAADERNTSFGCSSQREWTYFGDAFFNMSLRPGTDLKVAFENAKHLIRGWEAMDRFRPSNPQGHFGSALMQRLQPVLEAKTREQ